MGLEFVIYNSEGTGQNGVGGGPTLNRADSLIPIDTTAPYRGQGPRYVYQKYFLNVTQYDESGNAPVISSLLVSSITSTGAVATWTTATPATSILNYGTTTAYGEEQDNGGILSIAHSIAMTGLANDTLYYVKARSAGIENVESFTTTSFNTLDVVAPVISNLRAISVSSTGATIIWDTNESSTGRLQYGIVHTDNSVPVSVFNTSYSFPIVGLTPNTTYQYMATVGDDSGNTSSSNIKTLSTASGGGPPALSITNIQSGSISSTEATITWTTNNLATSIVFYGNDAALLDNTDITLDNVLLHTGSLTDLNGGLRYYFAVSGNDIYGGSAIQSGYYFDTVDNVGPVISPGVVSVGETSATVRWNTNELANTVIRWGTESTSLISTGGNLVVYSLPHTGVMTPLLSNRTYYYQMESYDSSGNIGLYPIQSLITLDFTPPVISNVVVSPSSSNCALSWQTNERSVGTVSYGPTVSYGSNIVSNFGAYSQNHFVTIPSLSASTLYYYRITSTDSSLNSSNSTGSFTTAGVPGGGDTTPPIISNIQVPLGSITSNSASIIWQTNEPATSFVEYSASSFPGISGEDTTLTTSHTFNVSNLSSSTTYDFYVASKDASDNNSVVFGGEFTTENQGSSSFSDGDVVTYVEYTVPRRWNAPVAQWAPIRVVVPVKDNLDLALPWAVFTNNTWMPCQREVTKRRADGQACLAEIVFPVWVPSLANGIAYIQVVAKTSVSGYSWSQETIADSVINLNLPDGRVQTVPLLSSNISTRQVRGDSSSPWCRTYRHFSRFETSGNIADKSMVAHVYVTYYNYEYFPNARPVIDLRITNGQLNPSALASIGRVYFRTLVLKYPEVSNVVTHKVIPSTLWNSMRQDPRSLVIAKTLNNTPSSIGFPDYSTNDSSDNAFGAGMHMQRRFAMHDTLGTEYQQLEKSFTAMEYADLKNVGFAISGARNWTNVKAHGPVFTYLPDYSLIRYGELVGREAYERRMFTALGKTKSNLSQSIYDYDEFTGGDPGAGLRFEFGPWRPWWSTNGGGEGGFGIISYNGGGYTQSGLIVEMFLAMMKTATWSFALWDLTNGDPIRVETFLDGNNKLPYAVSLDGRLGGRTNLPFTRVGGQSDSETEYNIGTCSYLGGLDIYFNGGLKFYTPIDPAHTIRYYSSFIAPAEVGGDRMAIDDLLMFAASYRAMYCRYGTQGYALGYGLFDNYHGYVGQDTAPSMTAITADPFKGRDFGRQRGWPLYGMCEAYTFAKDQIRQDLAGDLNLWMLTLRDLTMPIGIPDRKRFNQPIMQQHPGIKCNGAIAYLNLNTPGSAPSSHTMTLNSIGSAAQLDTSVSSADGAKLITTFISTFKNNPDSIHLYDYERRIQDAIWQFLINSSVSSISGATKLRAELYTYRSDTGAEVLIGTADSLEINSLTINTSFFTVPILTELSVTEGYNGSGQFWQTLVRIKLYALTTSVSPIVLTTYYNGSQNSTTVTTINTIYRNVWDFAQVFEASIVLQAELALCKSYSESVDPITTITLYNYIKKFYDEFYKTDQGVNYAAHPLPPQGIRDYTSYYRTPSGGGFYTSDCWAIAVAKNPVENAGDGAPLTSMIDQKGRYSDDPDFFYSSFAILNAMIANEELGLGFNINGVLANRWRSMGTLQFSTPLDKAIYYITNGINIDLETYKLNTLLQAVGIIAHIQYANANSLLAETDTTEVPGLKIYLLSASNPETIEIGVSRNLNDSTSGSVFEGDQRDLDFYIGSGVTTDAPVFYKARGINQAISLYNRDGELGGPVSIGEDTDTMIPFWLRLRLDENQAPKNTSYMRLGVIGGIGPTDGAASVSDGSLDTDYGYFEGQLAQGQNYTSRVGNVLSFNYVGDENIKYVINLTSGQPSFSGALVVYEETSDSYPVVNGGLAYKSLVGTNYNIANIAPFTVLSGITQISDNSYAADYYMSLDGGSYMRHQFTIEGKSLKIRSYSLRTSWKNISGNYYAYTPGVMSGIENPCIVDMPGIGRIPTVCFDKTASDKYLMSCVVDLTKSNSNSYLQTSPSGVVPVDNTVNWANNLLYLRTSDNITIPQSVDETLNIIVSKNIKDVMFQYSRPASQYLSELRNKHVTLFSSPSPWVPQDPLSLRSNSWSNYINKMVECGVTDCLSYVFFFWTAETGTRFDLLGNEIAQLQNHGPTWYPAVNDSEFRSLLNYSNTVNWPIYSYQMYETVWSGNPSANFQLTDLAINTAGSFKHLTGINTAYSGQYDYFMSEKKSLPYVISEATELKANYNFSGVFWDVATYYLPSVLDTMDARVGSDSYTYKSVIRGRKTKFQSIKNIYNGPLLGEGSISDPTNEFDFLYAGYVDSLQGHINTHSSSVTFNLPSGSYRAPTVYPVVPEYNYRTVNKRQANHGLGFPERFFSLSDADCHATSPNTPIVSINDFFPFTQIALDRYRCYEIAYGRIGYTQSNGYYANDIDGDYQKFSTQVAEYYVLNELQRRYLNGNIQTIKYRMPNNQYSGFEEVLFAKKNMTGFSGAAIYYKFDTDLEMWVNPYKEVIEVKLQGYGIDDGDYTLPRDSWLAVAPDGFIGFSAIAAADRGNSNSTRIDYCYAPGRYELFDGRSGVASDGYGNITTSGNNLRLMKVYNFVNNNTIMKLTDSSVVVSGGLV